jgi:hypothetical protein
MFHAMTSCLLAAALTAATADALRAEIVQTNCGTPIQSIVPTSNELFQTTSKSFIRLRGAVATVKVPAGQRRCVKVRFTASATCRASVGFGTCFIRALADGEQLHPRTNGNQTFFGSTTAEPTGIGYQWIGRLDGGDHVIQIQLRTDNVPNLTIVAGVDDWTMDVEVLNVP